MAFRVRGPRLVTLTASEAVLLACPHENPWGPSVSVNEFRGPRTLDSGLERVEIELQSGDTLIVEAARWDWTEETTHPQP